MATQYLIKSGDNLNSIAQANNTTVANLQSLNPQITNPNLIYAGQNLNLPTSSTISATSMTPAEPLKFVGQNPDITNYAGITGGITDSIINDYKNLNQQLTDKQNAQETAGTDITKLMQDLTGKTADTQLANEQAGVNTEIASLNKSAQQLADLNAQASSLNREAQAIPLQTQENNRNTGATDAGVAPQNAGALRLNALKALSIGQQADIAAAAATGSQLRLQAARDKAQQVIDLKYKPLEDALAIKEKQYELNKDVLMSIDKKRAEALNLAIDKEKNALADVKAKQKANADTASEYAKYAMEGGQSDIASQISALDTSSKTFSQDLSKLQSKIKNPSLTLDLAIKQAQLNKLQKETRLLGEPTQKEKKEAEDALKNAKASIPAMNDKIDAVDLLLNNGGGFATRVGTNILSRKPLGFFGGVGKALTGVGIPLLAEDLGASVSGTGQQFAGGVHRLVSGLTLQSLIDAKAQGATFGALSDSELNILANSASAINDWEIKKDGKGTGVWNIDEASFKKELENIQNLTRRALVLSQKSVMTPEEQSLLDATFTNTDPSNYYK